MNNNFKEQATIIMVDLVVGGIIGIAGFQNLLPNILEPFSSFFNTGSFKALRGFTFSYFIFPLILIVLLWFFLVKWKLINESEKHSEILKKAYFFRKLFKLLLLIFLFTPITLFLKSQFLMDPFPFPYPLYLISGSAVFFLIFSFYINKHLVSDISQQKVFLVDYIVLLLYFFIGFSFISTVEPWYIYSKYYALVHVVIYLIFSTIGFVSLFIFFPKIKESIRVYLCFLVSNIVAGALLICNPSINTDYDQFIFWSINILNLCYVIITFLLFTKNAKDISKIRIFSKILNYCLILTPLCVFVSIISYAFINHKKDKGQFKYLANKLVAVEIISEKKISPFSLIKDSINNNDPILYQNLRLIERNNRLLKYFNLDNDVIEKLGFYKEGEKDSILFSKWYQSRKDTSNCQNFFFGGVHKLSNEFNTNKDKKDAYVDLKLYDKDEVYFYKLQQKYLNEDKKVEIQDLFQAHFKDIEKKAKIINELKEKRKDRYFDIHSHPIDYYHDNLNFYKTQAELAQNIIHNLLERDLLQKLDQEGLIQNKRKQLEQDINKDLTRLIFYEKKLSFQDEEEIQNVKKFISRYPILEYEEKFKKAQKLFSIYLMDSQRVGVYIFLVGISLIILAITIMIFYFKQGISLKSYLFNYLAISLILLIILLYRVILPVKAEFINPEQPYWMFQLKSWSIPIKPINFTKESNERKERLPVKEKREGNKSEINYKFSFDFKENEEKSSEISSSNENGIINELKKINENLEKGLSLKDGKNIENDTTSKN